MEETHDKDKDEPDADMARVGQKGEGDELGRGPSLALALKQKQFRTVRVADTASLEVRLFIVQAWIISGFFYLLTKFMRGLFLLLQLTPTMLIVFILTAISLFVSGLAMHPDLWGSLAYEVLAFGPRMINSFARSMTQQMGYRLGFFSSAESVPDTTTLEDVVITSVAGGLQAVALTTVVVPLTIYLLPFVKLFVALIRAT